MSDARGETRRAGHVFTAGALALAALAACAPRYDYAFAVAQPGARGAAPGARDVVADADVEAQVRVEPDAAAIELDLLDKTDQVVQVGWDRIALTRPDGHTTLLHPATDLGWIAPGQTVSARLVPFALPRTGDAALANEGAHFQLDIPVVVRREPRVVHVTLAAHVFPH